MEYNSDIIVELVLKLKQGFYKYKYIAVNQEKNNSRVREILTKPK